MRQIEAQFAPFQTIPRGLNNRASASGNGIVPRTKHTSRERLFVLSTITQIGRENKFSAEIFMPANSPLRMQRESSAVFSLYLCDTRFLSLKESRKPFAPYCFFDCGMI